MPAEAKVHSYAWGGYDDSRLAVKWLKARARIATRAGVEFVPPMNGDRVAWLIDVATEPQGLLQFDYTALEDGRFEYNDVHAEKARGLAILGFQHPEEFAALWSWARAEARKRGERKIEIARGALRSLAFRKQRKMGCGILEDPKVGVSYKELQTYLETRYKTPEHHAKYGKDWSDAVKEAFKPE